jgi:CheY-like chemotaxis protein/HPt (histidine-containing phosphotransfer) domain-containing protein
LDGRPFDVAIVGIGPQQAALQAAVELRAAPGCDGMALVLLKDVGAPAAGYGSPFARELTRPLKQAALYEAVVGAARPGALATVGSGLDREPPVEELPAGLHVLVAEDNEVNRELLVRQLGKLGVSSVAVASGGEALQEVRSRRYDAVLMDVHMPEVDGLQAARAIRGLTGERRATPIVAVTASDTPGERDGCTAAGMDGFLAKPITSRDLAAALGSALRQSAAEVRPAQLPPAIDAAVVERLDEDIGDRAELRRIAGIFLDQMGPSARALTEAAEAGDCEALQRAAHRLGSASSTFGACHLGELCRRFEALGAAGRAGAAADLVGSLEMERERAAAELLRLLEIG